MIKLDGSSLISRNDLRVASKLLLLAEMKSERSEMERRRRVRKISQMRILRKLRRT